MAARTGRRIARCERTGSLVLRHITRASAVEQVIAISIVVQLSLHQHTNLESASWNWIAAQQQVGESCACDIRYRGCCCDERNFL